VLAVPADSVLAASSKTIPFHTFLWKIASRCNLNCSYCYVYNLADSEWRRQPPFMDLATARQAAVRMREHLVVHNKTSASIIFHGGEPLLAGRDGIEALLDTIGDAFRGSGIELSFGIQTNLLLFDVPIAELLRDRNVALGVSIDGPPAVNDALRVDRAGRGSSRELEEKLALLTSQRYRPIFSGFLSVIQPRSDAAAVIDYLASFRPPSMDFLLPLDNHDRLPPGMSAACGPSPYGRWLLRAFEHWLTLRPPIVVRTFNTIVALLCGAPSQVEHLGLTPVDLVVIETNGEIEGVDSLKGAFPGATQLGLNVFSHDFDQAAVHTEVLKRQHGRQDLCNTCRSCDVVEVCGAGYLPHRFSTARKFDNPSVYCADLYALIHRIREALIAELQSTSVQSAVRRVIGFSRQRIFNLGRHDRRPRTNRPACAEHPGRA